MDFLGRDSLSLKISKKKRDHSRPSPYLDHCSNTRSCSTPAELAGFGWNSCQRVDEPCFFSSSSIPSHCSNSLSTSIWPRQGSNGSLSGDEDISTSMSMSAGLSTSRKRNKHTCRRWVFRFIQIGSICLCAVGIITLVINFLVLQPRRYPVPDSGLIESTYNFTTNKSLVSTTNIYESLRSWTNPEANEFESQSISKLSNGSSLLDIPNFYFIFNNAAICSAVQDTSTSVTSGVIDNQSSDSIFPDKEIYFMVLVHSAPDHFTERQSIRSTWGSVKSLKRAAIRLVFLLGQSNESKMASFLEPRIQKESQLFHDIVSGSFEDNYRNLTYKHIMGYKWALNFCPRARFILKTDDDAFIDIFQLFDFITRTYGFEPTDTLLCNVYPEGTKPVRLNEAEELNSLKWKVTSDEYPFDIYPKYCGGLAYLITPDVISSILSVSETLRRNKFFWIDDVFVTGVLRELTKKEPFYLNLRYAYDPDDYRRWLDDRNPRHRMRRIPFMIVHVERGPNFSEEMSWLWRKTLRVWSPE